MKKGEVSFEALVKLIPHILITVGLLFILVMFVASFYAKQKSPEEQDFQRIITELDELLDRSFVGNELSIRVPVQAKSVLDMIMYPAEDAPPICQKKSCVCLYQQKDGQIYPTCKTLPKITGRCREDQLGDCRVEANSLCFDRERRARMNPTDKVVTVSRTCEGVKIYGQVQV